MAGAMTHSDEAFDEAYAADGTPRAGYAAVLAAIENAGHGAVAAAMTDAARRAGFSLGARHACRFLPVDPVPRVFDAEEWSRLAKGLVQRARMLEAFDADVYGSRAAIARGAVPQSVIETSPYLERTFTGQPVVRSPLGIIGFDVVRLADGSFSVLEDNLLTPGHAAVWGLRNLAPLPAAPAPVDVFGPARAALLEMLGGVDTTVILADAGGDAASWELRQLSGALGIPVVGYEQLRSSSRGVSLEGEPVERIWQRTSEDRLHAGDGTPTALGELLLAPLLAGAVSVVNPIGCGVADDKRTFRYTAAITRALLGEEPLLPIVETLDLGVAEERSAALADPSRYVFKPRNGAGGRLVAIPPHNPEELLRLMAVAGESLIAQKFVTLSRHPTVVEQEFASRPVDLRVFAVRGLDGWTVLPGGVSRYPIDPGSLIVNTSQGGGVKDVWVTASSDDAS